jgi:hypothetical protein
MRSRKLLSEPGVTCPACATRTGSTPGCEEDPDSGPFVRRAGRTWILDAATGQQTEVHPPVQTWQRLAP